MRDGSLGREGGGLKAPGTQQSQGGVIPVAPFSFWARVHLSGASVWVPTRRRTATGLIQTARTTGQVTFTAPQSGAKLAAHEEIESHTRFGARRCIDMQVVCHRIWLMIRAKSVNGPSQMLRFGYRAYLKGYSAPRLGRHPVVRVQSKQQCKIASWGLQRLSFSFRSSFYSQPLSALHRSRSRS